MFSMTNNKKSGKPANCRLCGGTGLVRRWQPILSRSPVLWKTSRSMWGSRGFSRMPDLRPPHAHPVPAKLKLIAMSKRASGFLGKLR